MNCENCGCFSDGSYGSGRFCTSKCARGFSTKIKRLEINEKVKIKLAGKISGGVIAHSDVTKICQCCERKFTVKYSKRHAKFCSVKCRVLSKQITPDGVHPVVGFRQRLKLKAIEYKGGKCTECGYNKCVRALQFHHLDPTQKDFGIGGKSLAWEKMKVELDKCILVCSNCHNEIHEGLIDVTKWFIDVTK